MRGLLKFLLGLVIVLAIAWLGLWWYAQGRMQSGFTAWQAQLASQGWKIGYASETRGSSPARATLTLTNLTLSPPADDSGRTVTITLPTAVMRIEALNPLVLHTDLPNKINVDAGSAFDAAVTFTTVASQAALDPNVMFNKGAYPYRSGRFDATGIAILASQGSLLVLNIDHVAAHYTFDPSAGPSGRAVSLTEALDGVALSPLMTKLASIPFGGRISHLSLGVNLSGPVPPHLSGLMAQIKAIPFGDQDAQMKLLAPVVHDWAAKGGSGDASFGAVIGPSTLNTAGSLKFDAKVQPEGTGDLTADHLDQFFAAVTSAYPDVQSTVAQTEAQLSAYITTTPQSGQKLTLHAVFGNGVVNVNGQKAADLPPVDWNALANPPPAPAPDSGAASPSDDATPDNAPTGSPPAAPASP